MVWALGAHAQNVEIKPAVNILFEATTNSQGTVTPQKDLIITTSPELDVSVRGVRSSLNAHLRVDNIQYVRSNQPGLGPTDQSLPNGDIKLHSALLDQWGGVDASAVTRQTKASLLSVPTGTSDSYTTTQARLSPYLDHAFDANTVLQARLTRSETHSTETLPRTTTQSDPQRRPTRYQDERSLRLERRPSPLGATLEWNYNNTRDAKLPQSLFTQNIARSALMYAVNDQVQAGVLLGREWIEVASQDLQRSDPVRGVRLGLHPNERATLDTDVERRFFGTAWKLDLQHRMPFMAWQLQSKREPSTSTPLLTQAPCQPDELPVQCGLTQLQPAASSVYPLSPKLLRSTFLRWVLMGKRNTVTLSAGVTQTEQLKDIPLDQSELYKFTRERYADAQFTRRLTPQTSLTTGVRWSLNSAAPRNDDSVLSTRDLTIRGAINTKLSPYTTATMGVRRQHTIGPQVTTTPPAPRDESAMFVGLGYRY